MEWLWLSAILLMALGLMGMVLPVLPGVALLFGGMLLAAWIDDFTRISTMTLIILGVLALLAWAVDFFASLFTAKRAGACPQALWGTVIGSLLGLPLGIVGLIVGPIIGAAVGEIMAHRDTQRAASVGLAAGFGFVVAMIAKLIIALMMLAIFAYAYYV